MLLAAFCSLKNWLYKSFLKLDTFLVTRVAILMEILLSELLMLHL